MMEPTKEAALGLKRRIRAGETLYGVATPMNVERSKLEAALEKGGFDFVSVDSQHAAFNEERLIEFCQMCGATLSTFPPNPLSDYMCLTNHRQRQMAAVRALAPDPQTLYPTPHTPYNVPCARETRI